MLCDSVIKIQKDNSDQPFTQLSSPLLAQIHHSYLNVFSENVFECALLWICSKSIVLSFIWCLWILFFFFFVKERTNMQLRILRPLSGAPADGHSSGRSWHCFSTGVWPWQVRCGDVTAGQTETEAWASISGVMLIVNNKEVSRKQRHTIVKCLCDVLSAYVIYYWTNPFIPNFN